MQFAVAVAARFPGTERREATAFCLHLHAGAVQMQLALLFCIFFSFFGPVNLQSTVGGCWLHGYLPSVSCVHVKFKRLHILQDCRAQLTGIISSVDKKL